MRPFRGLPFSIIVAGHFYEINEIDYHRSISCFQHCFTESIGGIIMLSFSMALKSAEDFAKIKMRSYCEFKQCFVFRGAKPEEKLYGAVYVTVDRQTGKTDIY